MNENRSLYTELLNQGHNQEALDRLADCLPEDHIGAATRQLFAGVALQQSGRIEEAIVAYQQSAELSLSDLLLCWNNLAGACYHSGRFEQAVGYAESLREYKPFETEILALHVLSLIALRKTGEAEKEARDYARTVPRDKNALRWLIHAAWRNRKFVEPLVLGAQIPLEEWNSLGIGHELLQCLIDLELFEVADTLLVELYGTEFDPLHSEESWAVSALLALSAGRLEEAVSLYRLGIEKGYENPSAIFNLSLAELALGDFEEGWRHYLIRGNDPTKRALRLPENLPRWQGEPLAGKTLLIASEQGLGDMIQFVRFVPMVEALGARVVFASYADILALLRNDPRASVSKVEPLELKDIDYYALLLDLPLRLGVLKPSDIPRKIPYLYANETKANEWRKELSSLNGLKVGIVWAGNPDHGGDHHRSMSINAFAPLAGMPNVTFLGLQKGFGAREAKCPPEGLNFRWLGDQFIDFEDTAAAVANLDLVIAVDTSVVHLAAALGKPVWLLQSKRSLEWRWIRFGDENPWYPNVIVFQQDVNDDWAGLIKDKIRPVLAQKILADPDACLERWEHRILAVDSGESTLAEVDWQDWATNVVHAGAIEKAMSWLTRNLVEHDIGSAISALKKFLNCPEFCAQLSAFSGLCARNALKRGNGGEGVLALSSLFGAGEIGAIGRGGFADWGWFYYANRQYAEAVEIWTSATKAYESDGHLYYLLGIAQREIGDSKEAVAALQKATECLPRHYMAHLAIAGILREERMADAWLSAQKAMMYRKDNEAGWLLVVQFLHDRGAYRLAELVLTSRCRPGVEFSASLLRVKQLLMFGRDGEARTALSGLEIPSNATVKQQQDFATSLYYCGEKEGAISLLEHIANKNPESKETRFMLGFNLLRMGRCSDGWKNYWLGKRRDIPRRFTDWEGQPLGGKSILVVQDQGQGDVIQFFPLLDDLLSMTPKRLTLAVTPALVPLLASQGKSFEVINSEKIDWDNYRYDFQVDQMALPYLCKVDMLRPKICQPTLHVPEGLVSLWQEKISGDKNFRVGIVWSGGDLFKANFLRSTALSDWRPLWNVKGVSFYSLQKDIQSNQAAVFDLPLHNVAADCGNWLETLSIIQSLDLIITTCTAVAHAAGSINKATWILLSNEYVDFRWQEDRTDVPWYPSVRLVRRQRGEIWPDVFQRVAADLVDIYHLAWEDA